MQFHPQVQTEALMPAAEVVPTPRERGRPVGFGGCRGFLHWASGATGVVMLSPWGYEELVVRHAWRVLAEKLAAAGFPCLRFDYPGTADSIGDLADFVFEDWIETSRAACDLLRREGVQSLLLIGQSIGCLVACASALDRPDVAGLVLLAPANGRRYLRELAAWSSMLAEVEGQSMQGEDGSSIIAGFALPQSFAVAIRTFSLTARPAPWALLVEAPGRADPAFADRLAGLGVETEHLAFEGLDKLVGDPTTSRVPQATYANIVDILRRRAGASGALPARGRPPPAPRSELAAATYCEDVVYFGRDELLFGLLCRPVAKTTAAAVLFLNTGRNAHIGWSRATVEHARALAAQGIASLRIDIAGVGESPALPDRTTQFLYTQAPVPDVIAAIDVLAARGFTAITLVGICSGAYLALLAALADARVKSLVAINLPRFAWGKSESIETAIRFVNRPNSQSLKRVFNLSTLRAIATGKIDPRAALKFRIESAIRRIGLKLAPMIGPLSPSWPIYREACARIAILRSRQTNIFLGYVATDEGVEELDLLFGKRGKRLERYPSVKLGFVENSDHNLSQIPARDWLLASVIENHADT
jgi:pimeloyl-ACP methyl ester carboxylesterase